MNQRIGLGIIVLMTLGTTAIASAPQLQWAQGHIHINPRSAAAPVAVTGDDIYVAWWTNKTGNNNDEVMFRASTDSGKTFGDKINLSNTTNSDSTRVEIDSDENSVVVTWWETNETSDVPVMKISTDDGKTFGPLLKLASNETIGG